MILSYIIVYCIISLILYQGAKAATEDLAGHREWDALGYGGVDEVGAV